MRHPCMPCESLMGPGIMCTSNCIVCGCCRNMHHMGGAALLFEAHVAVRRALSQAARCFHVLVCHWLQVWTAERSTQLGMAVSSMLKGYTTTAAQIITAMLKSVTKFTIQVRVAAA